MPTVSLPRLTTAKALTSAELELINHTFWIIEAALNSVGATAPLSPGDSPISVVTLRHDQLQELSDDDHLQYLLLAGRVGNQVIIGNVDILGALTLGTPLDKAYIADRVRSIMIPVIDFHDYTTGGPIVTLALGTYPTAYVAYPMSGVTASQLIAKVIVPSDFVSVQGWDILYTNNGVSTNTVDWNLYVKNISNVEDCQGANDITMSSSHAPPNTAHVLDMFQIGSTGTGITADDILRISLDRDGLGDANAGNMNFMGLRMRYNSDM